MVKKIKKLKKLRSKNKHIFAILAFTIIFLTALSFYFSNLGDHALKNGRAPEARSYYYLALRLMPLRFDINAKLAATRLLEQNQLFYTKNNHEESSPSASEATKTAEAKEASPESIFYGKSLRVPIIMYHYISLNPKPEDKARNGLSTPPAVFEQQMKYLAENGYTTITLDKMAGAFSGHDSLPAKPIIITIDDGYNDAYYNAFPILKKYNLQATMLIITDVVDTAPYLSWSQIKEMYSSGLITFISHTRHHYFLTSLSQPALDNEIIESKKILESKLGTTINWFGYPYGGFNQRVIDTVRKAGFIGAVTTLPGVMQNEGQFYLLRRNRAGNISLDQFKSRL